MGNFDLNSPNMHSFFYIILKNTDLHARGDTIFVQQKIRLFKHKYQSYEYVSVAMETKIIFMDS